MSGPGKTKNGYLPDYSLRDLFVAASEVALKDAGIKHVDIDGVFVGNFGAPNLTGENSISALVADYGGFIPAPAVSVEGACTSGGHALRLGVMAVLSGMHDIVMVTGAEKMNDLPTSRVTEAIAKAADVKEEFFSGLTFPSMIAMITAKYMGMTGATEEDIANVAVKARNYGNENPYAHFRFQCSLNDVLKSPYVADPIKLLECCGITDGASAIVLGKADLVRKMDRPPVYVIGCGAANDYYSITDKEIGMGMPSVKHAAQMAYKQAGVSPEDIEIGELYNSFSPIEILCLEACGLAEEGKGYRCAIDGDTALGGKIPTNLSGGVLCKGHPIGATGVTQVVDLVQQLRGEATGVQMEPYPKLGLAANPGGSGGATCTVTIIRRED